MIRHTLLMAVLTEMDRLAARLQALTQTQGEDWQEEYIADRRQISLCISEMVHLAEQDLAMSAQDARRLHGAFDEYRALVSSHQDRFPISAIALDDPVYLGSFNAVHESFLSFKMLMADLIERYQVETVPI